jgi:hypothetical protein
MSNSSAQPAFQKEKQSLRKWQERLLPVMNGMLVGLTIFFFIATLLQLSYLHWSMLQIPRIDLSASFDIAPINAETPFAQTLATRKLEVLATLEAYLIERRYYEASVMLMSGLWIRYLGFVTGMILALVGASFILGKLQESASKIDVKWSDQFSVTLASASPGIILAVLGALLMFATIINRDEYKTNESGVYLPDSETPLILTATRSAPTALPITASDTPTPTGTSDPPPTTKNSLE